MFYESNAGLLTRVWHRFFDTDHSISASATGALVYVRASRAPNSLTESLIVELLADGPRTLDDMTEQIAEQLMREEIATGSWATDVGVWGPTLFRQEASSLIKRLEGDLLTIAPTMPVQTFGRFAIGTA